MFERYTEKARRIIFFARYEASQFGSPYIETEHLLLGLFREDKALAARFLPSHGAIESIRKQIEEHTTLREKVSTSVDLPLSHECKRVLAYGAEEAERLKHEHIDTVHLLLGLLREEKSFAAHLLREQRVSLKSVREQAQQSGTALARGPSLFMAALDRWVAEREARGGIWAVKHKRVGNSIADVTIFAGDTPKENEQSAEIRKRIDLIMQRMSNAIANHQFEKARIYSNEERKERDNLRHLCEQLNLQEPRPRIPLLCIDVSGDEPFSDVQKRCDEYIAEGVAHVWILNPNIKRAYTAAKTEGLREFKGDVLRIADPPLEMDLKILD
jgi:hypothetical protein